MTCLHLLALIELNAAGSYLAVRPSLYVSLMHHWVMLKEVKAVLERVGRDYEESLVSIQGVSKGTHEPLLLLD
jgi:hypothetical protein